MQELQEIVANSPFITTNIVYIALIVGLWAGITAFYVPGSGVIEAIALVILGASLFFLTVLPTNWLAVILIIMGISSFLVLPFAKPKYAQYAEAGLIFQVIGSFFLFRGESVSWVLILVTVGFALLYHRSVLLPMVRNQATHISFTEQDRDLVGLQGYVVAPLAPTGTVQVNGELWTAVTRDKVHLDHETPIQVIKQEGLKLIVEKAKREFAYTEETQYLNNGSENYLRKEN